MNIVYQGMFLKHGLKQSGHNIIVAPFHPRTPLMETLEGVDLPIDLVLIELLGASFTLPPALADCPYPMAVYAIDAPLNLFWLADICRLFDYVFVDQLSSAHKLKQHGVRAQWLPLCVQESDFKEPAQEKIHDIVFVGRESPHRTKRANLLHTLRQHYTLHTVQGISREAMMTLFAQAKIVLNENLFNGLTLRTFQGLASGSLLLTESPSYGLDHFFINGEHLVTYTPDSLIYTIGDILANYNKYHSIGEQGQALCREHHTSLARARSFFTAIEEKTAFNTRQAEPLRQFAETRGRYLYTQRFGGQLNTLASAFTSMTVPVHPGQSSRPGLAPTAQPVPSGQSRHPGTPQHPLAAQAYLQLGDMASRRNAVQEAQSAYMSSLAIQPGLEGLLRLAFLHARTNNFLEAKQTLGKALQHVSRPYLVQNNFLLRLLEESTQCVELFFIIAHCYFSMGNICSLGFQKSWSDNTPDTAITVASLVWEKAPSPAVMDFILTCAKLEEAEGEFLPLLTAAIQQGLLNDSQILYTAELAHRYYNKDLAKRIASSFKQTLLRKQTLSPKA